MPEKPHAGQLPAGHDEPRRITVLVQLDGVVQARSQDVRGATVVLGRSQDHDRVCVATGVVAADYQDPVSGVAEESSRTDRECEDHQNEVAQATLPGESCPAF